MDLWNTLDAVKAQFIPSLETAEQWIAYTFNAAWFWFLLAMLAAVWISKRFVVKPLSRLIEFRTQVTQMESTVHMLANELRYVRLAVDELRGLVSKSKEEHNEIEDMRILADEFRSIVNSLRNERDESEQLRSTMHEIRSNLNSLRNGHDERTEELRSGLTSLVRDYEQAAAD